MRASRRCIASLLTAALVAFAPAAHPSGADGAQGTAGAQPSQPRPTFRGGTQLVSVDVVVRDASGAVVRGLTAADFEVTEDGKTQDIRSFSFEEIKANPAPVETADLLAGANAKLAEDTRRAPAAAPAAATPADNDAPKPMTSEQLAGRRLIILLFDVASMQPEDVQRAVDSASTFVDRNMVEGGGQPSPFVSQVHDTGGYARFLTDPWPGSEKSMTGRRAAYAMPVEAVHWRHR